MSQNTFCQNLAKLYSFLVETVDIPKESLEHDLVFKVCKQSAKCLWVQLISNDDAGWTTALKILVTVVICFTTCKCNNLCCDIGTKFLLACAVLNHNICTDLAILKADELQWHDIGSLMEQLIERMLAIGSRFTKEYRSGHIIYRLSKTID